MSNTASLPELYVIMSNASGKQNLGTYLRTASAFGATQVIVVGSDRFGTHGAHRAQKYVNIMHMYKFEDARQYLKKRGCTIYGIKPPHEVIATSIPAHLMAYTGNSAFVVDNEFPGLSSEQLAICDDFVYTPFHGQQVAPLQLDATVVTAIVLQHFCAWAQFPARAFEETSTQGKFVLDAFPVFDPLDRRAQEIAALREAKRIASSVEAAEESGMATFF